MVLKKRLDYGFNGYQIPVIPRAPRSVRRRVPHKKSVEDHQICAFELLAAVAGKLLQESESSASSNASEAKLQTSRHMVGMKKERVEENKAFRSECLDQGSCVESAFVPELAVGEQNFKSSVEGPPQLEHDSVLEHTSIATSPDFSKKVDCDLKLGISDNKIADGDFHCEVVDGSHLSEKLCNGKTETAAKRQVGGEIKRSQDLTGANTLNVKNQTEKCMNSNPIINSESSVQLSLYRGPVSGASFPKHRNNVNLGSRDDDDNSFGCNKLSTKIRTFRPQARNGYRRIRKMLQSKYWRVAPKLRDYEVSNTKGSFYRNRKFIHPRDRCQHEAPSKRRKLSGRSFVLAYDQEASSESISNSPEKGEYRRTDAISDKAHGSSASVKVHKKPKDSSVKLSIKSFKVPELYIEVPETATVGSLKRTVLETVSAILGGGLRVGVVLQGKKVRDDNRTLQQAGISHGGNLDSLGFVLEPNFTQAIEHPKDSSPQLQSVTDEKLLRPPASPLRNSGPSNATVDPLQVTKMEKQHESNHEIVLSPKTPVTDSKVVRDGAGTDCKALVPVAPVGAEPLAMVPVSQKMKRSEVSQRRTRRPFSVGEVEALVEAVEILGTGRWRDVKMRAFDNADHRTYVDLKDKWKTLVHTASIAPQQRRGEPVPQDLLDRVLSAHSYWSQHQSKQHGKHNLETLQIMDAQEERSEA